MVSRSLSPGVLQCPVPEIPLSFREDPHVSRKLHASRNVVWSKRERMSGMAKLESMPGKVWVITYGHLLLTLMHIKSFVME